MLNYFIIFIRNYYSVIERLIIEKVLQNRYEIVNQLGRGGMGAVYLAKDLRFEDSYVALKKITIEFDKLDAKQQKLFKTAFEREANLLAKLNHESIPRVTDYFSESDSQYLVMELVDGDDLGALLGKGKKFFPVDQVLEWSFQILDALDYLHNQNPPIIHRDLKPANLKLTTRGKIKLLDFGIAKGTETKGNNHTTITNHTFVGATLNYSPIEQLFRVIDPNYRDFIIEKFTDKATAVLHQNADTRSDTFALGATFYHLTTGQLPNDALKRALDVWAGKPDPLPNPTQLNPEISPELAEVLLRSLATDVDIRFSSAKEMTEAFHQALAAEKARKAKSATLGKAKKNKPIDLDNIPIPLNPDATQPYFPQQMDLGEKTQIEPIMSGGEVTQVEPINIIPSVLNEPEELIQDTQVGQTPLVPQDTQINNVTSTQEPKLEGVTFTDAPLNNNDEATRLPGNIANDDLTGVSYINRPVSNEAPADTEVKKVESRTESKPKELGEISLPPKAASAAAGLSKNSIFALASTGGVVLALIGACAIGYFAFFRGGGETLPNKNISPSNTRSANDYDYGKNNSTSPSPSPSELVGNTANVNSANAENKSTPPIQTSTPKPSTPRPDTPTPRPDTPTPRINTPTPTKPKCRKDPNDKSDACIFEGKCKQICN